jgi:hypothetical protein
MERNVQTHSLEKQFIQDNAQRPMIDSKRITFAAECFWCDVLRRSYVGFVTSSLPRPDGGTVECFKPEFPQSEIHEYEVTVEVDEDVGWF